MRNGEIIIEIQPRWKCLSLSGQLVIKLAKCVPLIGRAMI